jgi:hypothetical protein
LYYLLGPGLQELAVTYLRDELVFSVQNDRGAAQGATPLPLSQSPILTGLFDAGKAIFDGLNNVKQGFDEAPGKFISGIGNQAMDSYYVMKDSLRGLWYGPEAMRNQYESKFFQGLTRALDQGYEGETGATAALQFALDFGRDQVTSLIPFTGLVDGFNHAVETGDWTQYQKASGENAFHTLMAVGLERLFSPDEGGGGGGKGGAAEGGAAEGGGAAGEGGGAPKGGAPKGGMGNPELGNLIRDVAGKQNLGPAAKAKLLAEGAQKIPGTTFEPVPGIPGAEAVFKGATSGAGKTPILVVLKDGRIFRGWAEEALVPDPAGGPGLRIVINRMEEIQ